MKKIVISLVMMLSLAGCNNQKSSLQGTIKIDGSSTVAPISEAVIESFKKQNPDVDMTMGVSGTGGGFKRFVVNDTQISNASRLIKGSEDQMAKDNHVNYVELEIAKDALTVVVNKDNDWAKDLTTDQLQRIFSKGNEKIKWSDIDPSWPNHEIKIYAPGIDSGTFDYFKEAIIHNENEHREDIMQSEDDNILVTGVIGDKYSIAYFGYAYYLENKDMIRAVAIEGVLPSEESVLNNTYIPLSRPLFIYVNLDAYQNDETVKAFVDYYMENVKTLAKEVGYIPLDEDNYQIQIDRLK